VLEDHVRIATAGRLHDRQHLVQRISVCRNERVSCGLAAHPIEDAVDAGHALAGPARDLDAGRRAGIDRPLKHADAIGTDPIDERRKQRQSLAPRQPL
jgi:hypothetical protein